MTRQPSIALKPPVHRRAVAVGELKVSSQARAAIRAGRVAKGRPLEAGELAGLLAMKRTSDLVPHCHAVALTGSRVDLTLGPRSVRARVEAETLDRTGVEMEALVGATVALLTVWDMVKYLEKDARGLYPTTSLGPVRVVTKQKSAEEAP